MSLTKAECISHRARITNPDNCAKWQTKKFQVLLLSWRHQKTTEKMTKIILQNLQKTVKGLQHPRKCPEKKKKAHSKQQEIPRCFICPFPIHSPQGHGCGLEEVAVQFSLPFPELKGVEQTLFITCYSDWGLSFLVYVLPYSDFQYQ